MTLLDLITKINSCASQVPNIGHICNGNIYELNEFQNVKYPAFCATQGQHSQEGDWRYYNFTLFYVDRLISDKRNASEIQSEAIDVLSNIINEIEYYGIEINGSVLYDVFTERFESECAGAFCTVTFAVMKDDICPEWYRNPIRKIRYTMVEGQQLEDSDFEITGNAKFLYNDKENGVIALEVPFKEGYINFNCTRHGVGLKTIDFFDIDTEFRLGENGIGLGDNFDLDSVNFPETLTYLSGLRRTNIMSCILYGNVSYIGRGTFTNCQNLNTLGYNGTVAQWNAIEKYEADLPSYGTNWHGGKTTPNLCKVTCNNGEVPLCDKPGCPDCSDTGDTPSCSIDTPVCDADGVCTEDGICTEDGVCGSDCSTDTPVCDADGVCTEDGICDADGVCTYDGSTDTGNCVGTFTYSIGEIASETDLQDGEKYIMLASGNTMGMRWFSNAENNIYTVAVGNDSFTGPEVYNIYNNTCLQDTYIAIFYLRSSDGQLVADFDYGQTGQGIGIAPDGELIWHNPRNISIANDGRVYFDIDGIRKYFVFKPDNNNTHQFLAFAEEEVPSGAEYVYLHKITELS